MLPDAYTIAEFLRLDRHRKIGDWASRFVSVPGLRKENPLGSNVGNGVVRRPDELTPIGFRKFNPGPQTLFRVQKLPSAHQEPALDRLAVAAPVALPGRAAELDGPEVRPVGIEQR